jgi:hypothetical protein
MQFNLPNLFVAIALGNVFFFTILKASEAAGIRIPVPLSIIIATALATIVLTGFYCLVHRIKK